jgi:hypothetical protein
MMIMDYLGVIKYTANPPIENFQPSNYWLGAARYTQNGVYQEHYTRLAIL